MSTSVELTTPNGIKYTQPIGLYIDGEIVPASTGKMIETIYPATEEVITRVHEAGEEDVELAVKAAENAFKQWSTMPADERGDYLYRLADLIDKNVELLASVGSWDNGKSLNLARIDVIGIAKNYRNYAGWANKIFGDVIETDADHFTYTRREPIGVCGMITPWNYPLAQFSMKTAPALAAGCTVVLKSSEYTPLSVLLLSKLFNEAGFPKGVVNIVSGFGATGAIIANHPRIAKVAFTGSTDTGRRVMEASAKSNIKKLTLELGGKSANIVLEDADFASAIQAVIIGIFVNSGTVCTAGSRLFLHKSIHDKFLEVLIQSTKTLKVGDPFAADTFCGPLTSKMQFDKVVGYIQMGQKDGARLVTGGQRVGTKGFYLEPTIFADVKNDHVIAGEEIFGPVLSVIKFDTIEEVISLANDSEYGLAAGIHTKDLNRAVYLSRKLVAGTVWVNTYNDYHTQVPFGGFGASGFGRELGKEGLHSYTENKSIRIASILKGSE